MTFRADVGKCRGTPYGPQPDDANNPARRPLPERDSSDEEAPAWLKWHVCPPKEPGFYWVVATCQWPTIVEFRTKVFKFTGGRTRSEILPVSRAGCIIPMIWERYAGPIPDPAAPEFLRCKPWNSKYLERREHETSS